MSTIHRMIDNLYANERLYVYDVSGQLTSMVRAGNVEAARQQIKLEKFMNQDQRNLLRGILADDVKAALGDLL